MKPGHQPPVDSHLAFLRSGTEAEHQAIDGSEYMSVLLQGDATLEEALGFVRRHRLWLYSSSWWIAAASAQLGLAGCHGYVAIAQELAAELLEESGLRPPSVEKMQKIAYWPAADMRSFVALIYVVYGSLLGATVIYRKLTRNYQTGLRSVNPTAIAQIWRAAQPTLLSVSTDTEVRKATIEHAQQAFASAGSWLFSTSLDPR